MIVASQDLYLLPWIRKIVEFLKKNELIYNKRCKDYKDLHEHEILWDQFCKET